MGEINLSKDWWRNKESWMNTNPNNKRLIYEYEMHLEEQGKSKQTIGQYVNDVKIFACYVRYNCQNRAFYNLRAGTVKKFEKEILDRGMSIDRRNRMFVSCRGMYNFAMQEDGYSELYEVNPFNLPKKKTKKKKPKKVKPKKSENTKYTLTMENIQSVYEYLMDRQFYQQALFLSIIVDTQLTKPEIYTMSKRQLKHDITRPMTQVTYKYYIGQRGLDTKDYLWYDKNIVGIPTKIQTKDLDKWIRDWNRIIEVESGNRKCFNFARFKKAVVKLHDNNQLYYQQIREEYNAE